MAGQALAMMPWFPRDFMASTRGWLLLERAVYRELLDAQWEQGRLPADQSELARICGATAKEFKAAWGRVASKFVAAEGGGLINSRLEEHRAKALRIREVREASGRRGGHATVEAKRQATEQAKPQANGQANAVALATPVAEANFNYPSPSPSPSLPSGERSADAPPLNGEVRQEAAKSNGSAKGKRRGELSYFVPENFDVPDTDVEWAKREYPQLDLYAITQMFRDTEFPKPHSDWPKTWRNFVRRQFTFQGGSRGSARR